MKNKSGLYPGFSAVDGADSAFRDHLQTSESLRDRIRQLLEENNAGQVFDESVIYGVGYTRVSSVMQLESGNSLEDQEARILNYIQNQNWALLDVITDPAQSGRTGRRKGFQRLRKLIRQERVQVLVVDRIDRLARHLPTFLEFIDLLRDHNVKLISLREGIDYRRPWGKLVLYILGSLAEFYSENLSQEIRTKRVMEAANGKLGSTYRFGYCKGNCSECTDPNGKDYCSYFGGPDRRGNAFRIPHPVESVAVRLMFDWYASGRMSLSDIAKRLNRDIFALPDGTEVRFRTKGRPGLTPPAPFDADAVRAILSNPIYAGQVTYAGSTQNGKKFRKPRDIFVARHHDPIVSAQTFELVQHFRKLRAMRPDSEAHPAQAFPLSRLLFCAGRHSTMRALSSAGHRYYADRLCQCKYDNHHQSNIKAENIERQVRMVVGGIKLPGPWIQRIQAYLLYDEGESALLQDRMNLHQQLEAERYLLREGMISTAEFNRRKNQINTILAALDPGRIPASQEALQLLHNLPALLQALEPAEENALYRALFTAIYAEEEQLAGMEVYPAFVRLHPAFNLPGTHTPAQGSYPQP